MDRLHRIKFLSSNIPKIFRTGGIWNVDEEIEMVDIEGLCENTGIKFISIIPYSLGSVTPIVSFVSSLVHHIDESQLAANPPITLQEKNNLLKELTQDPIGVLILIFEFLKKTHKKKIIIYTICNRHFPMEDEIMEAIRSILQQFRDSVALVFQQNGYENKYINVLKYMPMDKTVYISYSHHAKDIDKYIKAIELGLTEAGIDYSIDFKNLLYRDNIKEYEEEIGKGFRCIAIITPEYLESPHCMYELAQIFENENVRERMFPLVDTGKYTRDTSGLSLLKEFWDTERNKTYEKAVSPSPFTAGELKTTDDIYHKLDSIWDYLRYTNSENIDELTQNKAEKLVSAIKKSFENEDTQKILEKSNLKTEGLSNIDRDVPFQQNVNQNGPNPITIGIANAPITINTYRN